MNVLSEVETAAAPWLLWAKLGIAAAIAGTILFQCHRIKSLEGDNTLLTAATQGYAQAQTTNLATITDLQTALRDVIEVNRMDEARAAAAATQSSLRQKEISDHLKATEKELADVYAHNANARAWGNTGVDAAVLARLPKPAAADADAGRRKAGAGAKAPAAGTGAH